MNASKSCVANSGAKIRPPSFSRSPPSTPRPARPAAMSLIARSMSLSIAASREQLLDVLGDDVDLEVDRIANLLDPEHGELQRGRDQPDAERVAGDGGDRERHPVDGDRA